MRHSRGKGVLIAGGALLTAVFGANALYVYGTGDQVTFTVTDKERIVESAGETTTSKYLVFTDSETFENTDSLLRLKFNSSDVQGQLQEGKTYEAEVYGWRIPFLSSYRNIVNVKPAPN